MKKRELRITCLAILCLCGQFGWANSGPSVDNDLNTVITSSQILLEKEKGGEVSDFISFQEGKAEEAISGTEEKIAHYIQKYGIRHCEVNGNQVPCEELLEDGESILGFFTQAFPVLKQLGNEFPALIKFGITLVLIGFFLSVAGFIFWLWMLIDAIQYQRENRVLRILLMVFFNVLGALVYLFTTKIGRKKIAED